MDTQIFKLFVKERRIAMIKLVPLNGLSNRMRAIDSAIALIDDLGTNLEIYWAEEDGMRCQFDDLFDPIPHDSVSIITSQSLPLRLRKSLKKHLYFPTILRKINSYIFFEAVQNAELSTFDFSKIQSEQNIIIRSWSRFYENSNQYKLLVPIQSIRERIEVRCNSFDEHTVGVHIRRTDNVKSINKSPNSLFVDAMKLEIEKEPLTNFYLATDCDETKQYFRDIFGDKILSAKDAATRDNVKGIQDAVVELYSLARTQKIYGSFWSSFSKTASHIGGIEGIILSND
jgi:hypothetical protein